MYVFVIETMWVGPCKWHNFPFRGEAVFKHYTTFQELSMSDLPWREGGLFFFLFCFVLFHSCMTIYKYYALISFRRASSTLKCRTAILVTIIVKVTIFFFFCSDNYDTNHF